MRNETRAAILHCLRNAAAQVSTVNEINATISLVKAEPFNPGAAQVEEVFDRFEKSGFDVDAAADILTLTKAACDEVDRLRAQAATFAYPLIQNVENIVNSGENLLDSITGMKMFNDVERIQRMQYLTLCMFREVLTALKDAK